ncbi:glycosyltransferase [Micromonosporaceae bacterium Da 78-11]
MTPEVLVSVGTDVHRFDRLMTWLETWYAGRPDRPAMLVQHGSSRAPVIPGATPFLGHDELTAAMAAARVVVTHGGPASITEARRHGHVPVVVARDPAYAEHVDNHQMLFAARMSAAGLIRLCTTADELAARLREVLASDGKEGTDRPDDSMIARAAAVAAVGRIVDDLVAAKRSRRRG